MTKNLLLATFIFIFLGIKAQTNADRKLLLQGFDEAKARKELVQQGLNPDEHIDRVRRSYMAKRVKELGLLKVSVGSHNDASHANTARNDNQHNSTFNSTCPNSSFQLLNFTGWTGNTGNVNTASTWTLAPTYTAGNVSYAPQPLNSPLIEGNGGPGSVLYGGFGFTQIPTTNRHNIMNAPPTNNNPASGSFSGYDSLAINPTTHLSDIPFVSPNGSGTSLRLGNANGGGETENITYSIAVTSATTLFTYQYAVVLNNPAGGHTPDTQPYFSITTKDQYGYPIDSTTSCGVYNVNTDAASTDTNYIHNSGDQYNALADVYYKKWTSVSVDLTQYIGQTVTITFQTYDCAFTAHFGYAYIDAFCGSPASASTVVGFCGTVNGNVTIIAPGGFVPNSYAWYGPNSSTTLATGTGVHTQTLTTTANINDTFIVKATSPSGCNSQFKIVVKPSNIVLNLNSTSTCRGGSVGSVSAVAIGGGSYNYTWTGSFGALGTNTVVTNLPPGSYSVHVVDNTNQCPPIDTVLNVISVNPTLQTITTQFCGTQPILNAPTGSLFQWYDNSNTLTAVTTQTNAISNPINGQHYTVTYKDPANQCEDSLKINLNKTTLVYDTATSHPCAGGNNGSINYTNVSTINVYNTYNWSVTGAVSNTGTTTATTPISLSNIGVGTYTMIISAPGNPTCSDTIKNNLIANNGIVIPNRDSSHTVCNMDTLRINANGNPNISHSWTGPGITFGVNTSATFSIAPVFTNTVPGFYTYTDSMRTAPGNCLSITKYIVRIKSFTNSSISVIEPLKCYRDSIAKIKVAVSSEKNGPISTPDKYTYTWSSSNPINSPNPTYVTGAPSSSILSNLKAGTYTCVIKNGNCINTVSYTLLGVPPLHTDSLYAYYCPKDSLALIVADTGNTNYVWHPNNIGVSVTGDSIYVPVANVNNYYVTYKHGNCPDTGKIMITVTTYDAFRPDELVNVFSPNGDKRNDFFYPFYSATLSQYQIFKQSDTYELTIYDRWGMLVYSATDYNKPWDGKTKSGHDADNGSYFFVVKYRSNCGTKADLVEKKGFLELMR